MNADVPTFRTMFPEFSSLPVSDTQILGWIQLGTSAINVRRLKDNYAIAVLLYAAHNLALGNNEQLVVTDNGTLGAPMAPMTSKSAGGMSASYDNALVSTAGAGAYNATSYGQRLWSILNAAGLGGFLGCRMRAMYAPFPMRTG